MTASVKASVEKHFGGWRGKGPAKLASVPLPPAVQGQRVVVVDRPGAVQTALFAAQLPALIATASGRLAIWVGPGGVHEVRWRRVRSMTHEEIRAIEFGYDPIGRLGFHPFYLELLLGPEARPFRLRRPYGARELRRVIDLMLQHENSLG